MTLFSVPEAAAQHHGAAPPPASLGDRQVALNFESSPKVITAGQTVAINIGFEDLGKQQNVQHVTFRMEVSKDGKGIFSDFFHGHAGEVKLQFRSGSASPTVNGNFDTLSGAWVGDPESPIVVNGKVFSDPGAYKTLVEVTGIDNDKTDLPEPLTYEFNILVFVDQFFEVSYQDMKFNVKTVSPVQISEADFLQEKKQLVITSADIINGTSQDFSIRVDVPKDMMSGPFTAALEYGTELGISENSTDASIRSLIITGQKHDVGMDLEGMGDITQHSHSIVISATNVLPEFPLGIASVAAALTIIGVLLAAKWYSLFLSGKTY
ncbi:MAG TPA: hypothetical protein VGJ42_02075 [Nitrososphaera sp.]